MKIINKIFSILIFLLFIQNNANSESFDDWLVKFKKRALNEGVSLKTIDLSLANVKFLPKVIEYDRYQPEF